MTCRMPPQRQHPELQLYPVGRLLGIPALQHTSIADSRMQPSIDTQQRRPACLGGAQTAHKTNPESVSASQPPPTCERQAEANCLALFGWTRPAAAGRRLCILRFLCC